MGHAGALVLSLVLMWMSSTSYSQQIAEQVQPDEILVAAPSGPADLILQQAVQNAAQQYQQNNTSKPVTLRLSNGLFQLTGTLAISFPLAIMGQEDTSVTWVRNATSLEPAFWVQSGVTFRNIKFLDVNSTAILINTTSSSEIVSIDNCTFTNNYPSEGLISATESSVLIRNCLFEENGATFPTELLATRTPMSPGFIVKLTNSNATIVGSTFVRNGHTTKYAPIDKLQKAKPDALVFEDVAMVGLYYQNTSALVYDRPMLNISSSIFINNTYPKAGEYGALILVSTSLAPMHGQASEYPAQRSYKNNDILQMRNSTEMDSDHHLLLNMENSVSMDNLASSIRVICSCPSQTCRSSGFCSARIHNVTFGNNGLSALRSKLAGSDVVAVRMFAATINMASCNFYGNKGFVPGAALHLNSVSGKVESCNFTNNQADIWGGAVYIHLPSALTISK